MKDPYRKLWLNIILETIGFGVFLGLLISLVYFLGGLAEGLK